MEVQSSKLKAQSLLACHPKRTSSCCTVEAPETSPEILVIGFGNELRGDDAAGPRVVAMLQEAGSLRDSEQPLQAEDPISVHQRSSAVSRLTGIAVHQLTPELAETISSVRGVVFVDAAMGISQSSARRVEPAQHPPRLGHRHAPADILALAGQLYGRCPPAWLVTIPAQQFDLGADLSPATQMALPQACEAVLAICAEIAHSPIESKVQIPATSTGPAL